MVIEATINLILSIILAHVIGPIGVAISSLLMLTLADLAVVPVVASRRLDIPLRELTLWIVGGMAIGLAIAGAIQAIPVHGPVGFLVRLLLGGALLAGVVLLVWKATGAQGLGRKPKAPQQVLTDRE